MLRLTLLVTGILSFLHFAFPQNTLNPKKIGDVLGAAKTENLINSRVIKTAVTIYCINKGKLPDNLNILYQDELSTNVILDLDRNFNFQKGKNCEFKLNSN